MSASRFHSNPYPEYTERNATCYLNGDEFEIGLLQRTRKVTNELWIKLDKMISHLAEEGDNSVYTGFGGIAFLYFIIGKRDNDMSKLERARDLCRNAIAKLRLKRVSFLNGDSGPLALGAVVYSVLGDTEECSKCVRKLLQMTKYVEKESSVPNEILYGRAGYLYSLLFVNKYIGKDAINNDVILKIVTSILTSGQEEAKKQGGTPPLFFEWHDKPYLGAAHGFAGIMYLLLLARDVIAEYQLRNLILPTIEWLLNFRFESFNFASSVGSDNDRLVQWCHGAPGFVHLFTLASQVFKEERFLEVAFQCSEIVWSRGLTAKGYSICHGVSGNAYTFMHLYKIKKDPVQLYRLACFLDWCTKYPSCQGMKPDRPYSLYEGIAGLIYFMEDSRDPSRSLFPAYEL